MARTMCPPRKFLPVGFYALVVGGLLAGCNVSDTSQREPLGDAGGGEDVALDAGPDADPNDAGDSEIDAGDSDGGCVDGEFCGEHCIDPMTSAEHCGGCGLACADGEVCVEGSCACAADELSCDEQCVAVLEDPLNCGDCGTVCRSGACSEGVCVAEACDADASPFGGGAGSEGDPFRICAAAQLMRVGDAGYRELNFGLFADLDISELSDEARAPIGSSAAPFNGRVDGRGYVIRNLSFGSGAGNNVALFGVMSGELHDLRLEHVDIAGGSDVAALVVLNTGSVSASSVQGTISSTGGAVGGLVARNEEGAEIRQSRSEIALVGGVSNLGMGGLVGVNRGEIIDSEFEGSIVSAGGGREVGGLVGGQSASGSIVGSRSFGAISVEGTGEAVGGLVGLTTDLSSISDALSEVVVSAPNSNRVGGLVGSIYVPGNQPGYDISVANCQARGSVQGQDDVGGLIGRSGASQRTAVLINDSHASGDVSGGARVGGFVGSMTGTVVTQSSASGDVEGVGNVGGFFANASYYTVNRCFASGNVSGESYVGGLGASVGYGSVNNSYATGSVTGHSQVAGLISAVAYGGPSRCYATGEVRGQEITGGLVAALNAPAGGSVNDSYWNITTSGLDRSDGGTGLYASQFSDASRFVGWDFEGVWEMSQAEGRPVLREP